MIQTVKEAQSVLAPVFDEYGIRRAVLFGSIAKGTATDRSDLDLIVDSGLRGLKFVGFIEAVHEAAGMPVDVMDVTHIDKARALTGRSRKQG